MAKTKRQNAIDIVNAMSNEYLNELIIRAHETISHMWIEVDPSGKVGETEEADNNTTHWIDYPNKEVATIYDIHQEQAEACNCDDCTMYRHFEDMDKDEFCDHYDEGAWKYCNENSLEDSILDSAHDNGIYADGIRQQMLDSIDEIPYGYFDDED